LKVPAAEIEVEAATVRQLLRAEFPSIAEQEIRLADQGWDNFTFRVGERHAARLPRRRLAVELLMNEQRWLPVLARRIPLEVPAPLHCGQPSGLFPWPWSVVRWVGGSTAEGHCFTAADAAILAETLLALHQPAPDDAPVNPFRGVPLRTKDAVVAERLQSLRKHPGIDAERLTAIWRQASGAPDTLQRAWMHGDLHPRNVIVRGGALAGLIDWGDLNGGDVAADVACAWMLIDAAALRQQFLETYGAPGDLIIRAQGWAIQIGLALVDSGEPRHVPLGLATLNRVVNDND
jgi:aminoglycoside phosphotransferase (APT) family kinase protein